MIADQVKKGIKYLYDVDALIVDTECTGFGVEDEVIEIACISFKTGTLLYHSYFIPTVKINFFAQKVHKLSLNILRQKGAQPFKNSAEEVYNLLARPVIAYNAQYDKRLLAQTFNKFKLNLPDRRWFCAMEAYTLLTGSKSKLENVCASFSVEAGKHDAISDAKATRNILLKMGDMDNAT